MSRALDKGVKEALRNGNHRHVFDQISEILTNHSVDDLLEIELLGESHVFDGDAAFLQDGNAVAIPKIRRVQAFVVAHQIFMKHLQRNDSASYDELLKATAVMLLMDPEHLTAANTRKRIIQENAGENINAWLLREKHLVDSLLTSRLHRHTKSPTLWSHRRWLMKECLAHSISIDVENDLKSIVMVSGERHPRNYHAWGHSRYLTNTFMIAQESLSRMTTETKKWCFSHHNDISGWQYLTFLLQKREEDIQIVFCETLGLVESFKWRNESVWYFLRNMATAPTLRDVDRSELVRVKNTLCENVPEDDHDRRILEHATQWAGL